MACRQLILLFLFGILHFSAIGQEVARPSLLRTDLIELTDRVWKICYLSSATLEEYLPFSPGRLWKPGQDPFVRQTFILLTAPTRRSDPAWKLLKQLNSQILPINNHLSFASLIRVIFLKFPHPL